MFGENKLAAKVSFNQDSKKGHVSSTAWQRRVGTGQHVAVDLAINNITSTWIA